MDRRKPVKGTRAEKFWQQVRKTERCWIWTGRLNDFGYGRFSDSGQWKQAHRISLELHGQAIPAGLVVDHICRERSCVNPAHLRIVTQRINALQNSAGPAPKNASKTHCKNGHEFSDANTYRRGGARMCRVCHRQAVQRHTDKRRNA